MPQIEFDEFVGIMAARMLKKDGDGEIQQAFNLFDDGSGYVHADKIRTMLMEMGSHALKGDEVDAILGMVNVDAEGRVALAEFTSLPCWEVPIPGGNQVTDAMARKRRAEAKSQAAVDAAPPPVRTTEAASMLSAEPEVQPPPAAAEEPAAETTAEEPAAPPAE